LPRGPKGGGSGAAAAGGDQGGGLHWPLHELITSFVVDRTDGEIQYEPNRAGGWLVAGGWWTHGTGITQHVRMWMCEFSRSTDLPLCEWNQTIHIYACVSVPRFYE